MRKRKGQSAEWSSMALHCMGEDKWHVLKSVVLGCIYPSFDSDLTLATLRLRASVETLWTHV